MLLPSIVVQSHVNGLPSGVEYVMTIFGLSALGAVIVALISAKLMGHNAAGEAVHKVTGASPAGVSSAAGAQPSGMAPVGDPAVAAHAKP
jgi:hypothetical protein